MKRWLLLLLWAAACSKGKPDAAPIVRTARADAARADAASAAPAASPLAGPVQQRASHKMRVRTSPGDAATPALTLGSELAKPSQVTLAAGSILELTLDDYAAIRLVGPAQLTLLPDGEPALLLREGLATIDCAPRAARSTTSAFWLATPGARLDVVQGARLVVRARAEQPGELAVVSGQVDVRMAAARPSAVGQGELRCLAENAPVAVRAAPPLAQLESAELWLRAHSLCMAKARTADVREPLRATLVTLSEQRAEEQALLTEHARLLAERSPQASSLPQKLALLAAKQLTEREYARALRASSEAAQLGQSLDAAELDLRERARQLAPYHD